MELGIEPVYRTRGDKTTMNGYIMKERVERLQATGRVPRHDKGKGRAHLLIAKDHLTWRSQSTSPR